MDAAESAVFMVVACKKHCVVFSAADGYHIAFVAFVRRKIEYEYEMTALESEHFIVFVHPFQVGIGLIENAITFQRGDHILIESVKLFVL